MASLTRGSADDLGLESDGFPSHSNGGGGGGSRVVESEEGGGGADGGHQGGLDQLVCDQCGHYCMVEDGGRESGEMD